MNQEVVLITQARTGSKRLFKKIFLQINGKSILRIHLERLLKSKFVNNIIVATTINEEDKIVVKEADLLGLKSFQGSESDVLDRFYQSVSKEKPRWIVRVTSDCPLIDPELIDRVIEFVQKNDVDYGSNVLLESFPDGQDIEVFKFSALEYAWKNATLKSEREHVTLYIRNNSDFNNGNIFKAINYNCEQNFGNVRMTVDEQADFELIKILIEKLGDDKSWIEYTNYIISNNLSYMNEKITRNEGLIKSIKND